MLGIARQHSACRQIATTDEDEGATVEQPAQHNEEEEATVHPAPHNNELR
jgi:hypothetical protein